MGRRNPPPTLTYARRLEEYQHLRERAILYRAALGVGVDRAEQVLAGLERKVSTMLDLRKQTVVHRDGTAEKLQLPAASPAASTALRFAGSTFTPAKSQDPSILLFVSDDEYARSSAQALESMGLAGKWQQAGACQVNIRNSGPAGAAVSITIKVTAGQSLVSGHAVFADGHGVEFGWTGWPATLLPEDDTPETHNDRQVQRLAYAEQVARDWAGAGYETMEIARIWLAG